MEYTQPNFIQLHNLPGNESEKHCIRGSSPGSDKYRVFSVYPSFSLLNECAYIGVNMRKGWEAGKRPAHESGKKALVEGMGKTTDPSGKSKRVQWGGGGESAKMK